MIQYVLIETLWNVKCFHDAPIMSFGLRINRNIVECKERLRKIGYYGNIVLIETLWNVKQPIPSETIRIYSGINSNIVECKDENAIADGLIANKSINRNIVECKVKFKQKCKFLCIRINRNIVECKGAILSGWMQIVAY